VLLSGDSGVGKSSLLMRFTSDLFDDQSIPTIGMQMQWASHVLLFLTLQRH
jgi:GTPase SAR1 family protein